MKQRTKELVRAARAIRQEASTRSGNDEPTWLVPSEELLNLIGALDAFDGPDGLW